MSRGQQSGVLSTAEKNSNTDTANAAASYENANDSINNYQQNLAKFVSSNPYSDGGEYAKDVNTGLANVSDAGSNSLAGALQSQARRTGMNSAAGLATAQSGAQQNTRDLSSALASADQSRIGNEASYNEQGLQASAVPISANSSLYGTALSGGNSALSTGASAATTPSFWDTVGNSFGKALGSAPFSAATGS